MICVGLLTTIRMSGTAAFRAWAVVDAELGSGIAGWGLVGVPGDFDSVSAPGVAVLGIWDSEPAVPVLGVAVPLVV
jgi:L-alanine-DL-glutamate epimerase-like enolase superfamily enzyme